MSRVLNYLGNAYDGLVQYLSNKGQLINQLINNQLHLVICIFSLIYLKIMPITLQWLCKHKYW